MRDVDIDLRLADHERAVHTIDAVSALYCALSYLVHGDTFAAVDALHRLDDDVVALAATVGTYLSIGAQQVMAERADPYHLAEDQGGYPVGAGRRRTL